MNNISRSVDLLMSQREKQLLSDAVEAAESLTRSLESLKSALSCRGGRTAEDFRRPERLCKPRRQS